MVVLGVRVKSGWAMTVLLSGPADRPRVLDRRRIELADPDEPHSVQPYHAGMGTAQTNQRIIDRLARIVERATRRAIDRLVRDHARAGTVPRAAGLVVGSVIDPSSIGNPHIRAHACEGALFRRVVVESLKRRGVRCTVVVEREVYRMAASTAGLTERRMKTTVAELGAQVEGRWRAEEKTAAAAALLVFASRRR
jgi:hypothetical protein